MILPEVKRIAKTWDTIGAKHEERQARYQPRHKEAGALNEPSSSSSLGRVTDTDSSLDGCIIKGDSSRGSAVIYTPVLGQSQLVPPPPSKLICIGRSYDYNFPDAKRPKARPEPLLFLMPPTSAIVNGGKALLPSCPRDPDKICMGWYEVELCAVIGKQTKDVTVSQASDCIAGYVLGIELALKEVLDDAKQRGLPWTTSKAIDGFAPLSGFVPLDDVPDPANVELSLKLNDKTVISGNTSSMVYSIAELVAYASSIMTLVPGDIIMTGSPASPGPFYVGDTLCATMRTQRIDRSIQDQDRYEGQGKTQSSDDERKHVEEWKQVASVQVKVGAKAPRQAQLVSNTEDGKHNVELWLQRIS
ncbi:hypothetical protein K437DRAFT_270456 [Tilletiaria anomala UBC 951]|uniref:Fumarylacetoacetase-like C-terminal domain-containing protein n=1 Tax=Tilletiaria anomala (strain ATCC 24038 / CBS 436.72 / UBC 951) TaxID=1037660 RepID=A0A066VJH5_TILAU|nr:uncharacterized protein K437DRAFT_270456 [Tilletiaria anomala UBC 951]KDN38874.1 hypothetical protein K437DRAFT_270456 [Tilletiaria anomala UBC 951]